jgi:hypothetical protein
VGALNDQVGFFAPDEPPPCTDDADGRAVVVCDGPLLDAKMAALDAHASQTRPLRAMVGDASLPPVVPRSRRSPMPRLAGASAGRSCGARREPGAVRVADPHRRGRGHRAVHGDDR